jgi:uncharacterized protein YndB with AHSA1/START domain
MRASTARSIIVFLAGLAATVGSAEAQTRTVATTVHVAASPDRVLRSFVDPGDLQGWWKVSRSLTQARPGGVWSVTWDDHGQEKTQHSWVGIVEAVESDRLSIDHLVMIEPGRPLFGPLQLEIVVKPEEDGTSLTVYHRGYRSGEHWDWMHDTVVAGWRQVLGDMQTWFLHLAELSRFTSGMEGNLAEVE